MHGPSGVHARAVAALVESAQHVRSVVFVVQLFASGVFSYFIESPRYVQSVWLERASEQTMSGNGIERYKSAGVHTVEGNLAGARAARLAKERDQQQQDYEQKKQEIQLSNQRGARIDSNFESHRDDDETEFKVRFAACYDDGSHARAHLFAHIWVYLPLYSHQQRQTVGLVTAEEFRRKRENLQNRKDTVPSDAK